MTPPRSQYPDAERDTSRGPPADGTPELNSYEIRSDRTVFTESGNADGWIATDYTVTPSA